MRFNLVPDQKRAQPSHGRLIFIDRLGAGELSRQIRGHEDVVPVSHQRVNQESDASGRVTVNDGEVEMTSNDDGLQFEDATRVAVE